MKFIRRFLRTLFLTAVLLAAAAAGLYVYLKNAPFGYAREVMPGERALRNKAVSTAEGWLGANETDGSHTAILDIYNAHEPLAQGYTVLPEDNWCATFASAAAIECGLTDIVPTECGCERQIGLFRDIGCWEETDTYLPLPGDYIYYDWDAKPDFGDSAGWSDHVGIVVGTCGPFIKVIEGNRDDCVKYRIILRYDYRIRGYGLPDYAEKTN